MRSEQEIDRIAHEIIGGGIAIHRRHGPGCFESAYVPCLAYEMDRRKLKYRTRVPVDLIYDELIVRRAYEADFVVEDCIVIEVKAVEELARVHCRQMNTYLRLTGCPLGLLMNFGSETMREGIRRVVNNFPWGTPPYAACTK
jgi:iron complex transport system substrate-binding protein